MNDFDRLLSLADRIAKGTPVDSTGAHEIPEDARPKTLSSDDLEKLIVALRRIDPNGRDQAPLDEPSRRSPSRWAHLMIMSTIGPGAFGTVYRAHDPHLGLDVALELLEPSEPPESLSRLLEAGGRLARMRHPNVVRWYGVEESAGRAGMWTELVKGQTLEQLVTSQGPLSANDATRIGRAVCHAAAVIKQAGLPHADMAARNFVRDATGRVVLMEPISREPQDRTTADVVQAIGSLIAYLATAGNDAVPGQIAIPASLASVIEQATSTDAGRRFATLDAFESKLAGAMTPNPDAPFAPTARRLWAAVAKLYCKMRRRGG